MRQALRGGWVSSRGPFVEAFERRFSAWVRGRFGVATTSGTTALHLALASLGVGPGDEVLIPDLTMVACVDAVLYTGARPVFVDVDPVTWTVRPDLVAEKVTERTAAIMPVHLYGHPADMDPLLSLARARSIPIVEDAAEAHGARYRGKPVGALGTLGCFSFYSNKILTTGEGGMVVGRSARLDRTARRLRDLAFAHRERDYRHTSVGFNYRMTNLQAAVGLGQLERAAASIRHHRACARVYDATLRGVDDLELPAEAPWAKSVYWMYTVRVRRGARARRRLADRLRRGGIETRVGFWPLHRQPFCASYVRSGERFPMSDALGNELLSLPSGNGISIEEVEFVARSVRELVRAK